MSAEVVTHPAVGGGGPSPLGGTGRDRDGAVHGRARHLDRERGAAVDQDRPELLAGEPAVGDHRLLDLLRRVPPPRRAARGSVRTPAPVHGGAGSVHRQLAARRARLVGGIPDRVPRFAGSRRRHDVARRAVDPDHDLRGGSRAQSGARDLGRRGRQRWRRGRAARRHPDQRVQLAVDLLRQRARRSRRHRRQPDRCYARAAPTCPIGTSTSPEQRRSRRG